MVKTGDIFVIAHRDRYFNDKGWISWGKHVVTDVIVDGRYPKRITVVFDNRYTAVGSNDTKEFFWFDGCYSVFKAEKAE